MPRKSKADMGWSQRSHSFFQNPARQLEHRKKGKRKTKQKIFGSWNVLTKGKESYPGCVKAEARHGLGVLSAVRPELGLGWNLTRSLLWKDKRQASHTRPEDQ